LLASHNNLAASAVAADSSYPVADIIAAVGFPWVPAVAGGPAAVVFTAVDVLGVPAVAKVSTVAYFC
jgi:hypothetical protein